MANKKNKQLKHNVVKPNPTEDGQYSSSLHLHPAKLFLYQKLCIFFVAFLVFSNGIPNGYNIDDGYYTAGENPITNMGIKGIPKIFTSHTLYDNGQVFEYRPISLLTFALQHQFIGDAPLTSHFINVALYALLCLLVFILLSRWFVSRFHWLAFFVTLLYSVHPLHTEIVDSIKNRDELLAAIFCYLSALSAWEWNKTGKKTHLISCITLFTVSIFCKTTIIAYAALIPFSLFYFAKAPAKKMVLLYFILCIPYLLGHGGVELLLPDQAKRIFHYAENPMLVMAVSPWVKTATSSYIMGWYLYLHFIPYPLSFYYGYAYVQLLNWNHIWPLLSFAIHLSLVIWITKNFRKRSVAVFGGIFYLLSIIPFSNLQATPTGMIAERFTFGSSLGYCIILVSFLFFACKAAPDIHFSGKNNKYMIIAFSIVFFSYSALTIVRNTQWKNHWTLYSHDIRHLQKSAIANVLYGEEVLIKTNYYREKYNTTTGNEKIAYKDSILQFLAEEKRPFLRALEIAPDYTQALNDIAIAYIREDSFEEAKKYLLQQRSKATNNTDALHYNLGTVYMNLGWKYNNTSLLDSAKDEFNNALRITPGYVNAYSKLSQIHFSQIDTNAGLQILLTGIKNNPDVPFLYMEAAKIYERRSDTEQILFYYQKAVEVSQPDPDLVMFLQNWYHNTGDFTKEEYYREKLNKMRYMANIAD